MQGASSKCKVTKRGTAPGTRHQTTERGLLIIWPVSESGNTTTRAMQPTRLIAFGFAMLLHVLVVVAVLWSTRDYVVGPEPAIEVDLINEVARQDDIFQPPIPRHWMPAVVAMTEIPNSVWQIEAREEEQAMEQTLVASAGPGPVAPDRAVAAVAESRELAFFCPERVAPGYPAQAKRLREQGEVTLRVTLDETGGVADVETLRSSGHARLDEAARTVVRSWRCKPALRGDRAVRMVALQTFEFVLNRR